MQSFIAALNGLANRLFDAGLSLPGVLGPAAEMAAVALLLGVVTAAVFHRFADRSALGAARRELGASLLEIWLYRHDPALVLRAEGRLLRANLRYLRGLLPPLALSAALAAPVLIQSWHRFGLEPAAPGAEVLLTAELAPGAGEPVWPELVWEAGKGEVTAVVRQPSVNRIVWRLRPQRERGPLPGPGRPQRNREPSRCYVGAAPRQRRRLQGVEPVAAADPPPGPAPAGGIRVAPRLAGVPPVRGRAADLAGGPVAARGLRHLPAPGPSLEPQTVSGRHAGAWEP